MTIFTLFNLKAAIQCAGLLLIGLLGQATALAQAPSVASPAASTLQVGYGAPISVAIARKVSEGALAEATRIGVPMVVAVTDTAGTLVHLVRMDDAISGGAVVAPQKAKSAALYKRPTKVFEDAIASGAAGLRFLLLADAIPIEGGLPIVINGKLVGAIGVSGGNGIQDGAVAKAGVDSLK